jgi:Txe/YoeB family toxin of Txe-Axe toxin-antitoxin module
MKRFLVLFAAVLSIIALNACSTVSSIAGSVGLDSSMGGILLEEGTYTFYPRPRGMRDGQDIDMYLDKIVVSDGFFNMYFVSIARGIPKDLPDMGSNVSLAYEGFIYDLDNPSKPPLHSTTRKNETGVRIVTFENHGIRNFSFTWRQTNTRTNESVDRIIEKITISEPDQIDSRPKLTDGTYTYYPRLRGMREGQDIDMYLDKIVVSNGFFNMYFVDRTLGIPRDLPDMGSNVSLAYDGLIYDLDNPSKPPLLAAKHTRETGLRIVTFDNHSIRNFSFTWLQTNTRTNESVDRVIENITVGEPDQIESLPAIPDGTYTFYPRLQAMREGQNINMYLDRIDIRGGFFTMYFVNAAEGTSRTSLDMGNSAAYTYDGLIYNLNDTTKPPLLAANYTHVREGGRTVTFANHGIRNFSFVWQDENDGAPRIIEEIILGEPDAE